jgi:sterol 3beta-glucosyltransferase
MRVLIAAAGGRGDVAPFTGLATAVRAAGHNVTIASNDQYESLVVGCGLEFRPLPGTHGLFEDPRWMQRGGGPAWAVTMVRMLAECLRTVDRAVLAVARQDAPDAVLLTGITSIGGYHVAERLGLPGIRLLLQPAHPTVDFPPSPVSGRSFGRLGNRAAGTATATAMAMVLAGPARQLRRELGLPRRGIREAISGEPDGRRWPMLHGFSPAIVPRPADWPDSHQVTGFWWPERPVAWRPPEDLEDFLGSGPPPVFFGFGDMTPDNASEFIDLAAAAGRQAGVRQVIQAGPTIQAGQTGPAAARPVPPSGDSIVVGDLPHDWLFPKMAAVVHHAGAGTTAAGLRAGVPAVTVPVLADQPFWAARLAALGVGPRPIPSKRLSVAALASAIRDAVTRPSCREQAESLAKRLASEDGAAPVTSWLAGLHGS